MTPPARVRFAPSPTGFLHLGGARTALYNFLLARQTGGQFILRIEDTDRKRLVAGAYEDLLESLHWLGLEWDEGPLRGGPDGPYSQSERKEIYLDHAHRLVESGQAYYCFCTPQRLADLRVRQQQRKEPPRYDGLCRRLSPAQARARAESGEPHVVRFKVPAEGSTTAQDLLRGEITVENRNLDDFILLKSDGLALYHLAAMVDDHLMRITHVIRSSEWLPSLPLHALIHRAFGWEEPIWVHLSVFLKPSGRGKMSKRESAEYLAGGHSIFVRDLRDLGYIPEGVLNWIALMGASFDEKRDVFNLEELIERFNLAHLNPAPASINFTKQDHFNGVHIRRLASEDLAERLTPFFTQAGLEADRPTLLRVVPLIQERVVTLSDAPQVAGFFFREDVHPNPRDLLGKGMTAEQSADALRAARDLLSRFGSLEDLGVEAQSRELAASRGLEPGQLFGILRSAITGQTVSPHSLGPWRSSGRSASCAGWIGPKRP